MRKIALSGIADRTAEALEYRRHRYAALGMRLRVEKSTPRA